MILLSTPAQEREYEKASIRWIWLWRLAIVLGLAIHLCISGNLLFKSKQRYAVLKPMLEHADEHHKDAEHLVQIAAYIKSYEAAQHDRQANHERIDKLYHRLQDYHAVNLRWLRVKDDAISCGIEDISESAVQQYQSYLSKLQYKLVSQQLIEKIWFLDFVKYDNH